MTTGRYLFLILLIPSLFLFVCNTETKEVKSAEEISCLERKVPGFQDFIQENMDA